MESGNTVIYIAGEEFMQCKFLLLDIHVDQYDYLYNLDSIDEISENLDSSLDPVEGRERPFEISPETEFWGHCSNLQIWTENDYNTNLLHSDLAFPLLKKLTEAKDSKAKQVFKKEILKRLNSGYTPVIAYLAGNGYLEHFSEEELIQIFRGIDFESFSYPYKYEKLKFIRDIFENFPSCLKSELMPIFKKEIAKHLISIAAEDSNSNDYNYYTLMLIDENYLDYLNDDELNMCIYELKENLPLERFEELKDDQIFFRTRLRSLLLRFDQDIGEMRIITRLEGVLNTKLSAIEHDNPHFSDHSSVYVLKDNKVIQLNLSRFKIKTVPKLILKLKSLEILDLSQNEITSLPEQICLLKSLKILNLSRNKLTNLPESIGGLSQMTDLDLRNNLLKSLPSAMVNLKKLNNLFLERNEFEDFPNIIFKLNTLTNLSIGRFLKNLPESIGNLKHIECLDFEKNLLKTIPESIGRFKQLKTLGLSRNELIKLPESIGNLKNLEWLLLDNNNLKELPETIGNLPKLKVLSLWKNSIKLFPDSIINLKKLDNLTIDYEMIKNIPTFVLKQLEYKISIFNKGNFSRLKKPKRVKFKRA